MDPKATTPATPNPSAATLHNVQLQDCVSLEKILDQSNLHDESSDPLQRTGYPTLQWPPTLVPATISLTLPHELVERILLLLDARSVVKCRLVNRKFNAIIQSSTLVQYYLTCKTAGVIDNPHSSLSYAERLEALKRREDAWRKLNPVFETTIKVNYQASTSLYELTAGIYFRTHKNRKDLYYCHLPSSLQDDPKWFKIPDHGPGKGWFGSIIEINMAIYEHDLVVKVISSEVENQADMQRYSLDLVLLKFSTREYHPLARHPIVHVQRSPSVRPYAAVRIVADNIALIVHDEDGSKLFIFDWKTGHRRLRHKLTGSAYEYSVPVFVSPDLLLVPNHVLSCFEVWYLFASNSNPNSPIQILSLQIPAISDNYSTTTFRCYGELSPFLHSMPYFPPRPFFPSPDESIITVNFRLDPIHSGPPKRYKLIMHRRALLDVIQKWTSPSLLEQNEGLPTWLMNEVTMHNVADPDNGSIRRGAQSELVSMMPHLGFFPRTRLSPTLTTSQTSQTSFTLHISAGPINASISSGSASSTSSRYSILRVQWASWGPPISRWFPLNGTYKSRTMQSAGQRCIFVDPNPHNESKCTVSVADFNQYNVRRNAEMMAQVRRGQCDDNGNNEEGKKEENEELEILDHEGVFSEEVYMGLKCVVYQAPGEYDFDVVLMDEQRLLGLKFDGEHWKIQVLYIG